jgi:hypothetical protein
VAHVVFGGDADGAEVVPVGDDEIAGGSRDDTGDRPAPAPSRRRT